MKDGPQKAFDYFAAALPAVLRKNTELELLLAKLRRERLGTRSERISPEQLALLLESIQQLDPVESGASMTASAEAQARDDAALDTVTERVEQASAQAGSSDRARASWHMRRAERRVHQALTAEERIYASCGGEKRYLGADITRQLEYVPAHSSSTSITARSTRAPGARMP